MVCIFSDRSLPLSIVDCCKRANKKFSFHVGRRSRILLNSRLSRLWMGHQNFVIAKKISRKRSIFAAFRAKTSCLACVRLCVPAFELACRSAILSYSNWRSASGAPWYEILYDGIAYVGPVCVAPRPILCKRTSRPQKNSHWGGRRAHRCIADIARSRHQIYPNNSLEVGFAARRPEGA